MTKINQHEPKYTQGSFDVLYFSRDFKNNELKIEFNEYQDQDGRREIRTVNVYTTLKGTAKKDRTAHSYRTTIIDAYHSGTGKSNHKSLNTIWDLDNKTELKKLKNKLESGFFICKDLKYNYWIRNGSGERLKFSELCQSGKTITLINEV